MSVYAEWPDEPAQRAEQVWSYLVAADDPDLTARVALFETYYMTTRAMPDQLDELYARVLDIYALLNSRPPYRKPWWRRLIDRFRHRTSQPGRHRGGASCTSIPHT